MEGYEIFDKTKKFARYWWRYYNPVGVEFADYWQECALVFFCKLCRYSYDGQVALAKQAYRWKLLEMMRVVRLGKVVEINERICGRADNELFLIEDIGLKERDRKICEGLIEGYSYKELGTNKHQICRIRKIVGDYFEIDEKRRSRNSTATEKVKTHSKELYKQMGAKLLACAVESNKRPVNAIKDGEVVMSFGSLKEAALSVGLKSSGSIRKSINGLCKARGFYWQYA